MNETLVRHIKAKPSDIGRVVGFDKFTDLHNTWLKKMIFGKNDITILGHRSSYKTSCLSVAIALLMILYPDRNIIFLRKTDDDVKEVIRQVSNILKTPVFEWIVEEIYGTTIGFNADTAFELDTTLNTSTRGVSQLLGIGTSGSLTGKHAHTVFTDDIVNLRDRVSRAERERVKTVYMELQNIKVRGGRIINTGTPWHKEDAISTLMPNVERYDCYSTGLMSKEEIADVRSKMTDSLFSANYELKHIADSDALFKNPQFTDKQDLLYGCIGHIDAGYGGGDSTAFTMLKQQPDGGFVAFGKRWQKHVDECLPAIKELHKAFRCGSIACEKNADKGYLAKELRSMGIPADLYSENTNKFVKISTYLVRDWKRIKWLDITDPEYIGEILDYTEYAEHDDCPDSIASLLRKFENRVVVSHLKGGL